MNMKQKKSIEFIKKYKYYLLPISFFIILIIVFIINSIFKISQSEVYCTISLSSNEVVNDEINLIVKSYGRGVKIKTPTGEIINKKKYEMTIKENGVYAFEAITSYDQKKCALAVYNIDKEYPNVSLKPSITDDYKLQLTISATDNLGLNKEAYSLDGETWDSSNIKIVNDYQDHNIFVRDQAGNIKKVLCRVIKVDYKIDVGAKLDLKSEYSNITNQLVSSDESIALVNEEGLVEIKRSGKVALSQVDDNNNEIFILVIETGNIDVEKVTLSEREIKLQVGDEYDELEISKIEPQTAICDTLVWKSSNEEILDIEDNKILKAKKVGKVEVSVICDGIKEEVDVSITRKITFTDQEFNIVKNMVNSSGVKKAQVAIINNGGIVDSYAYGCLESDSFYVSSISKTVLGIIAAKMQEDGLIDLDDLISKYWYALQDADFTTCTADWRSYIGDQNTIKKYTNKKLVENDPTIRHALTHSSTILNDGMSNRVPNDKSTQYFGGSLSRTYAVAAFMLAHTYGQLFERYQVPGVKTEYDYQKDILTREHALAGFTMQVAMKQSINEYLQEKILTPLGINGPKFKKGNSIYFSTAYETNAIDLAKIIAVLADDGWYNGKKILEEETIYEIEKEEPHLANQTIAFTNVNGKLIRNGYFEKITGDSYYDLDHLKDYYSYVSYDKVTGNGFVITTYGNVVQGKNLASSIESYVYANS